MDDFTPGERISFLYCLREFEHTFEEHKVLTSLKTINQSLLEKNLNAAWSQHNKNIFVQTADEPNYILHFSVGYNKVNISD